MPPPPRSQGKSQKDRVRDSTQNPPNRSTTPTSSAPPSNQSRSGTSTPESSTGPTPVSNASSVLIPSDVREYMHSKWQKFYDEALAQEKSPLPTTILYTSPPTAPQQQGWNTVGGKSGAKGANPWGAQNRHLTAKGTTFLQALKTAIDEANNPQKGG